MKLLNVKTPSSSDTWSKYHEDGKSVSIKNNESITITFDAKEQSLGKWTINNEKLKSGMKFNGPHGNEKSVQLTLSNGTQSSPLTFTK